MWGYSRVPHLLVLSSPAPLELTRLRHHFHLVQMVQARRERPPPWRCSPSAPATKRPRPLLHTHTHTVCAPHENGTRNAHAVITPTAQTSTPPPSTSSTSFASFTQKKSNSYYTFSLRTQRAPISLSHAQVCDASQSLRLRSSSRENTLRLYMPLSSYTILSDTMAIYA